MLKNLLALLLLLLSFNTHAQSQENIPMFIEQWRQENHIPAVALAIKFLGKTTTVYLKGYTTLNGHTKITSNSLYGVGSITKTFVAATILQLQESHKINLDNSIGGYFPEYPRWRKVTIRQLLNMTSGIPNFTQTKTFKHLIEFKPTMYHSLSFFVNLAYRQNDKFSSGKGWYYSNTNYYLLGILIKKVTHQSLLHVFQKRFFKPKTK